MLMKKPPLDQSYGHAAQKLDLIRGQGGNAAQPLP